MTESVLVPDADGGRNRIRQSPSRAAPRERRIRLLPRAALGPPTADRVAPAGAAAQPPLPRQGGTRTTRCRFFTLHIMLKRLPNSKNRQTKVGNLFREMFEAIIWHGFSAKLPSLK